MLLGQGGWEVLRQLWDAGRELPMLLLNARDSVEDRVKGLDLGAEEPDATLHTLAF